MGGSVTDLIKRYFPQSQWSNALAVAKCESHLDPKSHNWNPKTGDDSWGVFQINRYGNLAASRPSPEWLIVPENNIRYAADMWSRQGWSDPWGCARLLHIK